MATRPIYIPQSSGDFLVKTEMVEFKFHSGFAVTQKQKSIDELHQAAQTQLHLNQILNVSSREAKKDERLKNSGNLLKFQFKGTEWALEPMTAFYDWLYINALNQNSAFHEQLMNYDAFTDIEFNHNKSINCQAYSVAMFVALAKRDLLNQIREPEQFLQFYSDFKLYNIHENSENKLF